MNGEAHGALAESAAGQPSSFVLATGKGCLNAAGIRRRLEPGRLGNLAERAGSHFVQAQAQSGPELLVGAIPFDHNADDFLFQPETISNSAPQPAGAKMRQGRWEVDTDPGRPHYEAAVAKALEHIAVSRKDVDRLEKIVLSRSLLLTADAPVDVAALYQRLGDDPGVVRFLTQLPEHADGRRRQLIGATPELLIRKAGSALLSHPLAGSARRSADPDTDRAAAESLMKSQKDRREHRWVVEAIMDGLAPYCRELVAPAVPCLVSTRSMWHLGTRIEGQLRDSHGVSVAELVAVLHPTPAVGGTPRARALALIPELEAYDRGFYAGAIGWLNPTGDGEWYVSLRCAEVTGRQVRVYAGAGIVEGSVPAQEAEETSAKLQAVLCALGVDENGHGRMQSAMRLPA